MSLKKCHECGHEVSSSAMQCPNCGAYVNNSNTIIWVVAVIVLIILGIFVYYAWHNSEGQQLKRMQENSRKWMEIPKFELNSMKLKF